MSPPPHREWVVDRRSVGLAVTAKSPCPCGLDRSHSSAEPGSDGSKNQSYCAKESACSNRIGRYVGSFCRLPPCGFHGLTVLLLILLDLGTSLFNRDVLRLRQSLSGAVSRLLSLVLIARECRSDCRDRRVAQRCRIVAAGRITHTPFDGCKRIRGLRCRRLSRTARGRRDITGRVRHGAISTADDAADS